MTNGDDPGATPLFVDTGAFYAWFVETSRRHDRARAVFEAIGTGEIGYQVRGPATEN